MDNRTFSAVLDNQGYCTETRETSEVGAVNAMLREAEVAKKDDGQDKYRRDAEVELRPKRLQPDAGIAGVRKKTEIWEIENV